MHMCWIACFGLPVQGTAPRISLKWRGGAEQLTHGCSQVVGYDMPPARLSTIKTCES